VQHGLAQLAHVVARHVQHGGLAPAPGRSSPGRVQQRELLDLLVRGEQVALARRSAKHDRVRTALLAVRTRWPWRARRCAIQAGSARALDRVHAHAARRRRPARRTSRS
jgi:hypothetical protein